MGEGNREGGECVGGGASALVGRSSRSRSCVYPYSSLPSNRSSLQLPLGTPMEVDQFCSPSVVNILHLLACLCSHPSLLRVTLPAILDYLLWLAREPFSVDNVELAMAGGSSALEAVEAILEMDDHRVSTCLCAS